ncbi:MULTISPECIES: hypothetical protein [unclassified Pseudoalteromonas]|uniref:hypothetical protein n=1 Tax=unclassified Pseudoalteromonas TaxID=194690 RepID=UPI000CF7153C|nr:MULTISPECIES: hypothetical protein [unclassified Pseudoalteromonas]
MDYEEFLPQIPKDDKRAAYYRACIIEFERQGYCDQILRELDNDLDDKAKTQGIPLLVLGNGA